MVHKTLTSEEELKQSLFAEGMNTLGVDVWHFLTQDLQQLVVDSLLMKRIIRGTSYYDGKRSDDGRITYPIKGIFNDYSFALAPAYKLFEGFVYLVAIKVGVLRPSDLHKFISVGSLTNLPTARKEYREMIEKISGMINDPKLLSRWQGLYDTFEDFRNSPAHYSNSFRRSYDEVDAEISHLLVEIKTMTRYLFHSDIFGEPNRLSSTFYSVGDVRLLEEIHEDDYEPEPPEK